MGGSGRDLAGGQSCNDHHTFWLSWLEQTDTRSVAPELNSYSRPGIHLYCFLVNAILSIPVIPQSALDKWSDPVGI